MRLIQVHAVLLGNTDCIFLRQRVEIARYLVAAVPFPVKIDRNIEGVTAKVVITGGDTHHSKSVSYFKTGFLHPFHQIGGLF